MYLENIENGVHAASHRQRGKQFPTFPDVPDRCYFAQGKLSPSNVLARPPSFYQGCILLETSFYIHEIYVSETGLL